jgi:hypothetical protein
MAMAHLPETTVHVLVSRFCWQEGSIEGEVRANQWLWRFCWCFRKGELYLEPSSGRGLIREALSRFLEKSDYHLEAGGSYSFVVRSRF